MDSQITKFLRSERYLRNKTGTSADNPIQVQLNTDWLVDALRVQVSVSQTWGTNAPTGFDPRKVFKRLVVRSDKYGEQFAGDFAAFYDLFCFYDATYGVTTTAFGAGGGAAATASFYFELTFSNDEAKRDVLTALKSQDLGSLYLDLYPSVDTANGFSGGTGTAGATSFTVAVDEYYLPYLSNSANSNDGYGQCVRWVKKLATPTGNASATPYEIDLSNDNSAKGHKTRAILLQFQDTSSGAYVDTVLDYVTIDGLPNLQGGIALSAIHDYSVRSKNIQLRYINKTGIYLLDFGDDEQGWLDLAGVTKPKLKFQSKAGAPAAWACAIHQDITTGMAAIHATLTAAEAEVLRINHAHNVIKPAA